MSRYYWIASPGAAIAVGAGLCLWYVLDPPHIAGIASGARHVSLAFGVLLIAYGGVRLLMGSDRDGLGGPIRWPLVVAACTVGVLGMLRTGEHQRATQQDAIERGIDEVDAWETREAARGAVRQYLNLRARGDGVGACSLLTPSLRAELRAEVRVPCGRAVLASLDRGPTPVTPLEAFAGDPMWVDLDGEWSSTRRAMIGPEGVRSPVVEVVRSSAADGWLINDVWPGEPPDLAGSFGAAPS